MTAVVDVSFEERYWYPDDGGVVWLAGFQLVDPATGSYIGRDAPELAERGLRVAGIAGAARFHGEALASSELEPGSALELRRDPGNEHDPNAIAVHAAAGEQVGWVPRELAEEIAPRDRRGPAVGGRRAARAASFAARPAHGPDDAARRRWRDRAARGQPRRCTRIRTASIWRWPYEPS